MNDERQVMPTDTRSKQNGDTATVAGGDSGASPALARHGIEALFDPLAPHNTPSTPFTAEGAWDKWLGDRKMMSFPADCINFAQHYAATETARADRAEQLENALRERAEEAESKCSDARHKLWAAESDLKTSNQHAEELNSALAEARKAAEWVRCEDRLPEADTLVLIASNEGGVFTGKYRHFVGGRKFWLPTGNGTYAANWRVTHWRPLPEPPKEAASAV